jgi:hypothetical protein
MDTVAFLNFLQRQAPARSVVVPISGRTSA